MCTCSEDDRRLHAAGAERLGHTRNFSRLGERVACMSEIRRCSSGQSDWAASVPAAFVGLAACRMLAAPPETSWLPRGRPAAGLEQQGKQNWQHSMPKTPPLTTLPATVLADSTCTRSTPASIDQMSLEAALAAKLRLQATPALQLPMLLPCLSWLPTAAATCYVLAWLVSGWYFLAS